MAHLLHLVSAALVALLLLNSSNMSEQAPSIDQTLSRLARSTNESKEEYCPYNSVCGWVFYLPFSRVVDYYMSNNCKCPEPSQCIKNTNDGAANNEYRCKNLTSTPPPEAPESPQETDPPKAQ